MTAGETLNVWFGPRLVGVLWRDAPGGIGLRYAPDWIAAGGFAVSRSLPLTNRRYAPAEGVAHRCFANLLPEGAVREHLVRDLKRRLTGIHDMARSRAARTPWRWNRGNPILARTCSSAP